MQAFAAQPRQLEPEVRLPARRIARFGTVTVVFAKTGCGRTPSQVLAQPSLELDVVSSGAEQAQQGSLGLLEAARIFGVLGRDAAVHEFAKVSECGIETPELSVVCPSKLELELSSPLPCPGIEAGQLLLRRASPEILPSERQEDRAQAAQQLDSIDTGARHLAQCCPQLVRGARGSAQGTGVQLRCRASQLEALFVAGVCDQELEDFSLLSRATGIAIGLFEPVQHCPGARVCDAGGLEGADRAPRCTHLTLQDVGPLQLEGADAARVRRQRDLVFQGAQNRFSAAGLPVNLCDTGHHRSVLAADGTEALEPGQAGITGDMGGGDLGGLRADLGLPVLVVAGREPQLEFEAFQHGWPVAPRFEEVSKLASRLVRARIQRDGAPEGFCCLFGAGELACQEPRAPGQKPSALDGASSLLEGDLQQVEPVGSSSHLLGESHCAPKRLGVAGFDLEDTAKMLQGVRGTGEGALQQRCQLHPNRNLLDAADPGELGFEQLHQRVGLSQAPVDVPQSARGTPVIGSFRQHPPVRLGGGGVVAKPAQGVAHAEVPVASLQGCLAGGGRAFAELDQVVISTRALVEIGQRLGEDGEGVAFQGHRREHLDGSVHVVQWARAQRGDADPQGDLRPASIQLPRFASASRLPLGLQGCESRLENTGEIGVALLDTELLDQELAGQRVSWIQGENLLVVDGRPRRIGTGFDTELRCPRVKDQRALRIRPGRELGFQRTQEIPGSVLLLVEPRQGLPEIGAVGAQGGGGLQVHDGLIRIDQAIAAQSSEPLSDLEVVLGRSVAELCHQSLACGLPLAEPLQQRVEPALGFPCHRGLAVGESGEQLPGFILPVQRLFENRRPLEIQRRSGFIVRFFGRARLEQFTKTRDIVRLAQRPLEARADLRTLRLPLVDLPQQSRRLGGETQPILQDLGAAQIEIAGLGRFRIELPASLAESLAECLEAPRSLQEVFEALP